MTNPIKNPLARFVDHFLNALLVLPGPRVFNSRGSDGQKRAIARPAWASPAIKREGVMLPPTASSSIDRPWWSYAPLIAFAVSFWPYARPILAVLEGQYVRFEAGAVIFSFLLFPAANLAFVVLFFVARQKITEATEQRLPVGSVKAAMWSSLLMMLIVPSIFVALLIYLPGESGPMIWMVGLFLQILVLPLLGWIGWFAGRGFYRVRH